jgi:hypothetical protein
LQALSDAKVADKLGLTSDEKQKVQDLSDELRQKRQDLFQGGGGGGFNQETMQKMRELTTSEDEKALGLLTADQKAQLEKMQGKKIDIDPATLFRGGRGGRGNRGGAGPNA